MHVREPPKSSHHTFATCPIPCNGRGSRDKHREMTFPANWNEDIKCLRLAPSTARLVILKELSIPLASLSIKKVGFLLP